MDPWVRKIPWRGKWQPTPVSLPGESHGRRSLVGHSPRGHRVRHDRATSFSSFLPVLIFTAVNWDRPPIGFKSIVLEFPAPTLGCDIADCCSSALRLLPPSTGGAALLFHFLVSHLSLPSHYLLVKGCFHGDARTHLHRGLAAGIIEVLSTPAKSDSSNSDPVIQRALGHLSFVSCICVLTG